MNKFWLNYCPDKCKPVYYERYVEDIFVLFRSPNHLEKSNEYFNTKHAHIKFTNENEVNWSLPFLDILISRHNKTFTTTVYSDFNNFISDEHKHGLVFTLIFRIFSIVSNFPKFPEKKIVY